MAIDNCSYSFFDLAQKALPDLMKEMRISIENPTLISQFLIPKKGVKTILKQHDVIKDFQGCYVLIKESKPLYVGISRQVFRRLWLHCRGNTHYTATLAYRIAAKQVASKMTRKARMDDNEFKKLFEKAKARIQQCSFAFVPIENDLALYLFEVYCAMELDTCEWNTFRTH